MSKERIDKQIDILSKLNAIGNYKLSFLSLFFIDGYQIMENDSPCQKYDEREIGSLANMFDVLTHILSEDFFDREPSVETLTELHAKCCQNIKGAMDNSFRGEKYQLNDAQAFWCLIDSFTSSRAGFKEAVRRIESYTHENHEKMHDDCFVSANEVGELPSNSVPEDWICKRGSKVNTDEQLDDIYTNNIEREGVVKKASSFAYFFYVAPGENEDFFIKKIDGSFLTLKQKIEDVGYSMTKDDVEQRRNAIVNCVQDLSWLHPWKDGNSRTFTQALSFWLMIKHGVGVPPMHYAPHRFGLYSHEELHQEVKTANKTSENILADNKYYFTHSLPLDRKAFKSTKQHIHVTKMVVIMDFKYHLTGMKITFAQSMVQKNY